VYQTAVKTTQLGQSGLEITHITVAGITAVSGSSFTVSTFAGEKVTVKETSSTVYDKGTSSSAATAVTKGQARPGARQGQQRARVRRCCCATR
jgi:hypothetical protein